MNQQADSVTLPAHARLVAREDVWIEGDAVAQLARVASLDGCLRAVGMPDLHPGRGIPVGAAFAFDGVVRPDLIGGDAGCGARVVATQGTKVSLDALERRAREAMEEDVFEGVDPGALFLAAWSVGPRALAGLDGVPEALSRLAEEEPEDDGLGPSGDPGAYLGTFERSLGTVGGGNHFVEISRVTEVRDRDRADALGLGRNAVVVVAHSGSRGLGGALARRWGPEALTGERVGAFLGELTGACRFARTNRFVLAWRLLRALGAARPSVLTGGFDVTHNDVRRETFEGRSVWVHRKGAAPAGEGAPTIVLGSRGAPSWVLQGAGDEATLRSVAHGAGRKMGRGEAREKLKGKYRRAELARTALGGRVLCDDPELLFEEHPDAYKPVEPVVASVVEAGLAAPVAALTPLVTVKR